MATFSGRNARITVGAPASEKIVSEMSSWSVKAKADSVDANVFGDGWGKSDVGLKNWDGSVEGFVDPTDTLGQKVFEDAFLSGDLVEGVRFYLKYSKTVGAQIAFYTGDVRITSFDVSIDGKGLGKLSMSFTGSGPFTKELDTVA